MTVASKGKHTPGPWEIFYARTGKHETIAIMLSGTRREIVSWVGFDASAFPKQNRANARLIAAAPDLLKELKEALESLKMESE